jgi:hypothetical protein
MHLPSSMSALNIFGHARTLPHLLLPGGMFWFTDLTLPAGLGLEAAIFPVALTTLYLSNIHVSQVLSQLTRFMEQVFLYRGFNKRVPSFSVCEVIGFRDQAAERKVVSVAIKVGWASSWK